MRLMVLIMLTAVLLGRFAPAESAIYDQPPTDDIWVSSCSTNPAGDTLLRAYGHNGYSVAPLGFPFSSSEWAAYMGYSYLKWNLASIPAGNYVVEEALLTVIHQIYPPFTLEMGQTYPLEARFIPPYFSEATWRYDDPQNQNPGALYGIGDLSAYNETARFPIPINLLANEANLGENSFNAMFNASVNGSVKQLGLALCSAMESGEHVDTTIYRVYSKEAGGGIVAPKLFIKYRPQYPLIKISSENPDSGVQIVCTPDYNGIAICATPYTLEYMTGSSFTLTASATAGDKVFHKWRKDGVDYSGNLSITDTADTNHNYVVVYSQAVANVSGVVNLEDIAGQNPNYGYKATFKIYKSGNANCEAPDVVKTVDLDANGNYSFQIDPQGADCTVVVKAGTQTAHDPSARYHFLAKKLTGVDLSGNAMLATVNLPNGDINDDNLIDAFDFTILMQAYDIAEDASLGQSDLTNDGYVDAFDFTILMLSYDSAGDACN